MNYMNLSVHYMQLTETFKNDLLSISHHFSKKKALSHMTKRWKYLLIYSVILSLCISRIYSKNPLARSSTFTRKMILQAVRSKRRTSLDCAQSSHHSASRSSEYRKIRMHRTRSFVGNTHSASSSYPMRVASSMSSSASSARRKTMEKPISA